MREIKLTQGKIALVDDEDFEWLNKYKWYARKSRDTWYADRRVGRKSIGMHRDILGFEIGDGEIGDHKDRNGLNNQRENLRRASYSSNSCNQKLNNRNKTGFKGVSFSTREQLWRACIYKNRQGMHVGYFKNIQDAVIARDKAARELYGEFAYINLPNKEKERMAT